LFARVSDGDDMAMGIFRDIGHCASVFNPVLFGFSEGPHYDHVNIVFSGIADDFNVWCAVFNDILIIAKITQPFAIGFF